jgi:hypothetical protein
MKTKKQKITEYENKLKSTEFSAFKELNLKQDFAIIDLKITDFNKIFSKFDLAREIEVSNLFNDFLLKEISIIPYKYDIELELYTSTKLTSDELSTLKIAIQNSYRFKIASTKLKIKRNLLKSYILFSLSALSLMFTFFTRQYSTFFVDETLLILSWFFLWEGSNVLVFNRFTLKRKLYIYLRLYESLITLKKS